MEGYTLATATPCIHISLRMGMDPKKTGRGRERRERQGGSVWRERGEAGRGGGDGGRRENGPERGGIAGKGEMGRGRELH